MIEATDREIDGHTYRYMPLMAGKARTLLDELIQRFGAPMGSAVEALDRAQGLTLDDDTEDMTKMAGKLAAPVGAAITGLAGQLDPAFHARLVKTLAAQTQVHTGAEKLVPLSTVIEIHFATSLLAETKWIGFCLECQYSDFLDLFKASAINAVAMRALANTHKSGSPKGSTGTFNASQQASSTVQG